MPKRVLKAIAKRMPKAGFKIKRKTSLLAGGAAFGAGTAFATAPTGRRTKAALHGAIGGTAGGFVAGAAVGLFHRGRGQKLEVYQKTKKKK